MNSRRLFLTRLLAPALVLALMTGCGPDKFRSYDGPPVTQILVNKAARQMRLMSGPQVLASYRIGLGNAPLGHKAFEGDGRTPEGAYWIDRRNPNSEYHLSLGISYPNQQDHARAAALGRSAGSDIFIHGRGPDGNARVRETWDWTAGCITVSDREIEEIYAMVRDGTPILITP